MNATDVIYPDEAIKIRKVDEIECEHPLQEDLLQEEASFRSMAAAARPRPIRSDCDHSFRARRISGTRPLGQISLHVIHCTQGATARAAASWFQNPLAEGSAHKVFDNKTCFRTLNDWEIPWGAPGANYHGLHYELAGFVDWKSLVWSHIHRKMLLRAAFHVARDCKRYGNPPRWLTVSQLKNGKKGLVTHLDCTRAYGGTHTDPGPQFPKRLFLSMVRVCYAAMKVKVIA